MDILPTNVSARERRPLKRDPTPAAPASGTTRLISTGAPAPVDSASALGLGARGAGRAPLIYSEGDGNWPLRSPILQATLDALARGLDSWVLAHRRQHRNARWQALPDPEHAYAYSIRHDEERVSDPRQFLVLEIGVADTYAYLIDPERRAPSESYPMALLASSSSARSPLGRLDSSDIEALVQAFEHAAAQRRSWVSSPAIKEGYRVIPVFHPPRESPSDGHLKGLAKRVTDRLSTILGDPALSP